ncbi:MAG TPA: GtrA family protein [Bacteroidales bacterium]|nr:GtrA family protein [Bacteroidales bacterium]
MNIFLIRTGELIRKSIDLLYPPFRKYMSPRFFRYGVTGTANLVFDWILYFVIYNFILRHRMLNLGFIILSSHIGTLAIKVPLVLLSGFLLQKYVTFYLSASEWRTQFFRYSVVFFLNILISYIGLKILVEVAGLWPTPSNIIVSVVTVAISYFSQKLYTFRNQAGESAGTPTGTNDQQ